VMVDNHVSAPVEKSDVFKPQAPKVLPHFKIGTGKAEALKAWEFGVEVLEEWLILIPIGLDPGILSVICKTRTSKLQIR